MSLSDDGASRPTHSAKSADVKGYSLSTLLKQRDSLQNTPISNALFEIIFQSIPNGITLYDNQGAIIFANKIGAYYYGYSSSKDLLAAKDIVDIRKRFLERFTLEDEHGNPFTPASSPVERVLHGEDRAEATFRCFDREAQREFWALSQASAVYDEHAQLAIVIGTIMDITEQKMAEIALRKSEESLRFMAESWRSRPYRAGSNESAQQRRQIFAEVERGDRACLAQ